MISVPIRVMLCDDSSMMRRLIRSTFHGIPDVTVVSEAIDGRDAVEKLVGVKPDVLILDLQMPGMDGIEAVRRIRKIDRGLPVIMFSSLTTEGGKATMDAISAGANDFATKPTEVGHIGQAVAHLRNELLPKIYHWARRPPSHEARSSADRRGAGRSGGPLVGSSAGPAAGGRLRPVEAIGVGVSTGGPQTLSAILSRLPEPLTVPIFIVQHMPAAFTGLLAQRLATVRNHRVFEATEGYVVQAGDIIIAPGDYHLTVMRQRGVVTTHLDQSPPQNSCRPAVDRLFRSLASCYGNRCLGVVLTGMGKDGTSGAAALKERGGCILVQDKATSAVWGMPGSVAQNGLADLIVPRDQIASEITRAIGCPQPTQRA